MTQRATGRPERSCRTGQNSDTVTTDSEQYSGEAKYVARRYEETIAALPIGEPMSTENVAEATDAPERTARYRLDQLAEAGIIEKKKLGHRTVVWIRHETEDAEGGAES